MRDGGREAGRGRGEEEEEQEEEDGEEGEEPREGGSRGSTASRAQMGHRRESGAALRAPPGGASSGRKETSARTISSRHTDERTTLLTGSCIETDRYPSSTDVSRTIVQHDRLP